MKKPKEDHPFFCHAKRCRKTAWETPEFLSADDWAMVEAVVKTLESGKPASFQFWLDSLTILEQRHFFYIIIGWPEGNIYCCNPTYVEKTAFPGLVKHTLPKLKDALKSKGVIK
jgi:hypothetical protein